MTTSDRFWSYPTVGLINMKVIHLTFNDVHDPENWTPDDVYDFEEWIMVTVGDEKGGSDFQLHVCTPMSISSLDSKRHIYMIEKWEGVSPLISQLDAFIHEIENDPTIILDRELAKHWLWEYEGM